MSIQGNTITLHCSSRTEATIDWCARRRSEVIERS